MFEFKTDRERRIWLAAMIDGEGSIGIMGYSRKRKDGSLSESYQVRVRVLNTNVAILETTQLAAGCGGIYARKPWTGARAHHKQLFEWRATNFAAAKLLGEIRDFLVAKQEQADLALRFQELIAAYPKATRGWRYGRIRYPEDEIARRRELHTQMKALNFRGRSYPGGETA